MLKSFKNFDNLKPSYASGRNYETLSIWYKLSRTNVIEINRRAKVANKTANINIQNRSLYTS